MKTEGFSHQLAAHAWMLPQDAAALFSDMGAGKTYVILSLIETTNVEDVAIICEKSGLYSWQAEIKKHTNFQSIFINQYDLHPTAPAPRLYLFNYDKFTTRGPKLFGMLKKIWNTGMVVLDESVRIKNERSKTARAITMACKGFKKRYILSGLPIPENPIDIYNQYRFLNYSFVRSMSRWQFRDFFMEETFPYHWEFRTNKEDLFWNWVNSKCFRVTEEELDLPQKNFNKVSFDLAKKQKQLYNDLLNFWEIDLEEKVITYDYIFTVLQKLRQVCSNFIYDDNHNAEFIDLAGVGKEEAFLALIIKLLGQGDNVVVWYNFWPEQTAIRSLLEGIVDYNSIHVVDGKTPDVGRAVALNSFQEGKSQVLIAQIQTLSKSVSLTSARYAIYYSLPYSGDDRAQSLKRLHRIGQERPVFYYDLVATGTIEERIRKLLFEKAKWGEFLQGVTLKELKL